MPGVVLEIGPAHCWHVALFEQSDELRHHVVHFFVLEGHTYEAIDPLMCALDFMVAMDTASIPQAFRDAIGTSSHSSRWGMIAQ